MPSGEHPFDGDMILIKNKNKSKIFENLKRRNDRIFREAGESRTVHEIKQLGQCNFGITLVYLLNEIVSCRYDLFAVFLKSRHTRGNIR